MTKRKILLVGGGSGGHIVPIIRVAKKLTGRAEILFVGLDRGMDGNMAKAAGVPFIGIHSGKLRRYFSFENFVDIGNLFKGYFDSLKIIKQFKPDIIFAKGGYVSMPMVLAGRMKNVPIIAHESDIYMGLSNQIAGRIAHTILTGFPVKFYPRWVQVKAEEVGVPLEDDSKNQAKKEKLVLITGGSQGAVSMNRLLSKIVPELLKEGFIVVHQTGANSFMEMEKQRAVLPLSLESKYILEKVLSPIEMRRYMEKAMLCICRAGATTICELAAASVPMVLIPLVSSSGNHQVINAEYMQKIGIAKWFEETVAPNTLKEYILNLLNDKNGLNRMAKAGRVWVKTDASEKIAKMLLS